MDSQSLPKKMERSSYRAFILKHAYMTHSSTTNTFWQSHWTLRSAMKWCGNVVENGADGSMLIFIKNFLLERFIQVRVNGHLSKRVKLENGVPQGSVLSVTLFSISFNDITKCIPRPLKKSVFADDVTVYCSVKDFFITREIVQHCLNIHGQGKPVLNFPKQKPSA